MMLLFATRQTVNPKVSTETRDLMYAFAMSVSSKLIAPNFDARVLDIYAIEENIDALPKLFRAGSRVAGSVNAGTNIMPSIVSMCRVVEGSYSYGLLDSLAIESCIEDMRQVLLGIAWRDLE